MPIDQAKSKIQINNKEYAYYDIEKALDFLDIEAKNLPFSTKILLENLIRNYDGTNITKEQILSLVEQNCEEEISFCPTRVLMQDFTGVPAVVDLAAMRDAVDKLNLDPSIINPLTPVDLVIDHSVQVDKYGNKDAFKDNVSKEMERNLERYQFLKWGQQAFDNFTVVPPGTGICHQVNLEYLAKVIWSNKINGEDVLYPDSLVGTDSHTTMINGLSVLGWGVGGIEAEAAMLGQPISMLVPEVVGFKLTGKLNEGITATDLVLTITNILREKGVVGKFVEFFGPGLNNLALSDRATISNMAPEYGATCGFFPIDEETIKYLDISNRDSEQINIVKEYAKAQGLWRDNSTDPKFKDAIELDISKIKPSIAGPKRPQDKINLEDAAIKFGEISTSSNKGNKLKDGDIVIAAITSCTNTSNPDVMIAAGIIAKKANELGLKSKEWVKTSLAPGSKVVSDYLSQSGLDKHLDDLGFNLVGYGCTTCIGNSGPLNADIEKDIKDNDLFICSVLSGNRNFEGRVHPLTKANYLASPPLVVAYAIAGNMNINLTKDPIARINSRDIYLSDIWPSNEEISKVRNKILNKEMFKQQYENIFAGDDLWQEISVTNEKTYNWSDSSYIKNPPYFDNLSFDSNKSFEIKSANILALLGDSITTDHISPAGSIAKNSEAANYLRDNGVADEDFNSYGARRGNHEVMMRGTFANVRIKNEMAPGTEGGYTNFIDDNTITTIFDAAMRYKDLKRDLVIIAGKEYGTGSSRDWAAKGTKLLGVKAVIAESFERIHRSNLVGMGVLPFTLGQSKESLNLTGKESISVKINELTPKLKVPAEIKYEDGSIKSIELNVRLDTEKEIEYFINGGILNNVIKNMLAQ